jgi:ABC-type transport system substrate-binding protein
MHVLVPNPALRLAAALACAAALVGCGGTGAGNGGSAADGTTLRLAQLSEPTTLDPARVEDGNTIDLLMQVYNGLMQWNTDNKLSPDLAESWSTSNGGRTYTFKIREGVKFHNGRALTAHDLEYSIKRSLDPKTASPVAMSYLNDIVGAPAFHAGTASTLEGVQAPDDRTLKITIDAPKAYFLSKLTYPTAYAVCKEEIEKTNGEVTDQSMVGTGPFKLTEYRRGDRLILEANPDYWEGAPKLARMERRILLDNNTRRDKFEAGELDITDISMQMYRADKDAPGTADKIKTFQRPSVYYMALNQNFGPFKDRRVRQAFAHAINKDQILATVHEGVPQRAEGIVPNGVPGFDPNFKGLPYDPEKAKKLLAEAGYPGGQNFPPLKLSFRAGQDDVRNTAVALSGDIEKNLGIRCELDETEWATFLQRRNRGELPFSFLRWAADYLDPQNFLSTMLHSKAEQNDIAYRSPEFDRLCDQADVAQDAAKRAALYHQAERIAVDDAPWVPIYYQKDVELWNPKLRGVDDMLMGHLPHKRTHFEP